MRQVSGHVFRVERSRGPVWYAKYRLPSGRQVQKKLGPAWTGRGRPAAGYYTKEVAVWYGPAHMDIFREKVRIDLRVHGGGKSRWSSVVVARSSRSGTSSSSSSSRS